jgi:Protein phosphatase inhibitor
MATLQDGGTQASSSSSTAVQTVTELVAEVRPFTLPDGTLRLRGASADDRRVMWAEDVVDNEGMGKKKSKGVNTVKSLMPTFIYQQVLSHQYAASIINHALWANPPRKRNRHPPTRLQKVTATLAHQAAAARGDTVIMNAEAMGVGMIVGPERRGRIK